jgi:hypothetical protein
MLMRPKHPRVRLLTLKASGGHDLMAASKPNLQKQWLVGWDARRGPVTSFLFLRYRLRGFQVGAGVPDKDGMITVIL